MAYVMIILLFVFVVCMIVFAFKPSKRTLNTKSVKAPLQQRLIRNDISTQLYDMSEQRAITTRAPEAPLSSYHVRSKKKTEMAGRGPLKELCVAMLDEVAMEHPAGHGKLFARYVMLSENDERIELMFEKGEKSRANLWLTRKHALDALNDDVTFREYPASALYKPVELGGKTIYGRHAALKSMRDLANADLVRFRIDRLDQLQTILSKLSAANS